MASKVSHAIKWKQLHHLYLGLAGMVVSGLVGFKFVHDKDLLHIGPCILAGLLSGAWAADDWVYHWWGWHTPCWHVEQWLLGFKAWRKLKDFLNGIFGEEDDGDGSPTV